MSRDIVSLIREKLAEGGIEDACFEASVLLEEICGRSYKTDLLMGRLTLDDKQSKRLDEYISRRISGEPLQYIIGSWEFYGLEFAVGDGVLIPRQDTETLVDTAIALLDGAVAPKTVDLCSGTGCIPIAMSTRLEGLSACAIELYDKAYKYLLVNTKKYANVTPMQADVLDERVARSFCGLDMITANPPYLDDKDMLQLQREVEHEPASALFGGSDGLEYYRTIAGLWKNSLKAGGYIVFEIGITQAQAVSKILSGCGYESICVVNDLTGRPRVVYATSPEICTV